MNFLDSVVSRLPQWVLALVTVTILGYAGVLGGVAIFTERDVKFWPPEIGPGPKSKVVEELRRFSADLDKDISELLDQRKRLSDNLQTARSSMAKARSFAGISEALSWEGSAEKLEAEIQAIDKILISKIQTAKDEVKRIESRFNGS
ncbi:hypothetical protein [Pseudomonas alloputida]|uniref:hypothetical protein n=1 Tax=Pseudomonas alloputida TaxID=1940621 RepID=UPI001E53D4F7|nr:hypothetical protein [Pseudomonas alloputida]MCE1055907.1 hypothetical protein [Pseudomonas alloputida]